MTRSEVLEAVRGFFSILERSMSPEDREAALRAALDRLALAYHFAAAPSDDGDYPDPPAAEYGVLRARIGPLFPELGPYNAAREIAERVGDSEVVVGDAIDDIVDIARELHEVVQRWETTSEADALWHFRFGFTSHWGKHLRSLQLYLHERAHAYS